MKQIQQVTVAWIMMQ